MINCPLFQGEYPLNSSKSSIRVTQWHLVESDFDLCSAASSSYSNVKVKVHLWPRPGRAMQVTGGRRAEVKKKKKVPGRVDPAGLRGGRWGSGFSLTGGLGEGLAFWNIRRSIQGTVDIKPRCLPWRGGCRVPAGAPRRIPLRVWTVWLHGAISLWEHKLHTPLTESLVTAIHSLLTKLLHV